ncbi:MAG: hypothetical protein ACYTHM_10265 [Planctomycetota bacterium]|jgi:hypothetical protein
MAAPTKNRARAKSPRKRDSIGQSIGIAEMKLEYLRGFGVDTAGLDAMLRGAKSAFGKKDYAKSQKRLEELLVFFGIAAEEINAILARFLGSGKKGRPKPKTEGREALSLEAIQETVEEAFHKSLHSKGLRRMVEVIAMEKVRTVLADEGVPLRWIQDAVKRAVSELELPGRKRIRKERA